MRQITDEDIYRYYLGDIIVGEMYNSPIPGREDDTPSFSLYEKNGRILWIDFGLPNQFGNKPENLVQHLRRLPLTHAGYFRATNIIRREVARGMRGKPPTQLTKRRKREGTPYVRGRENMFDFELRYWGRFGVPESVLRDEWIEGLDFMNWSNKKDVCDLRSNPSDPAFIYWWNHNPASYKLYRPLARKRDKFRQEGVAGIIEGWGSLHRQIDPGKKLKALFINSASKDRVTVKTAIDRLQEYNGLNPRGEKDRQDLIAQKDYLFSIAERVIGMYDADDPGYEGVKALSDATGFEYYDVRGLLDEQKDFSDFVDTERGNHTHQELKELIFDICKL